MHYRIHSVVLASFALAAGLRAETPGMSVFLADRTVEYIPGTLPLIIAAPHGGQLEPSDIPDRKDGVTTRDAETDQLAIELADAIARRSGARPHLILCHLHREKVDCNRDALTGTGGNPKALATWRAFHEAIGKARAATGHGLYLDLHGHSHPVPRVEIGYLLNAEQLRETGPGLSALAQVSSLASMAKRTPGTFEGLLRGPVSLGGLLEKAGYPSVPSPSSPHPGGDPYFRGGYNTARYRTGGADDGFFAFQIECPKRGIRDTRENRLRFAEVLSVALEEWLAHHSEIRLGKGMKAAGKGGGG
jgi:N-formylglutamate amidohydrolase